MPTRSLFPINLYDLDLTDGASSTQVGSPLVVTFTTTHTVVAPAKTAQGQDRPHPLLRILVLPRRKTGTLNRSQGGMKAVMVERVPLTVPTRRKTVAQEEKGPRQTVTRATMRQTTLTSTRVDQAIDETVTGIVLGKLIRLTSKASRQALNGEPGAPIPYSPSSARRVVRAILHSHGS